MTIDDREHEVVPEEDGHLEIIDSYISEHSSDFAGRWTDQGTGEHVVAFTASVDGHRDRLLGLLPPAALVHVVEHDYSWDDLLQLQSDIDEVWHELRDEGAEITGTSIDSRRNRVVIGLLDVTPNACEVVTRRFPADMLAFEQQDYAIAL